MSTERPFIAQPVDDEPPDGKDTALLHPTWVPWWIAQDMPDPDTARRLLKALTATLIALALDAFERVDLAGLVNAALTQMDDRDHRSDLDAGTAAVLDLLDIGATP